MRNKIVMITAAVAVMMAMTGIAAAYGGDFGKNIFNIGGGNVDSSTLTYFTNFPAGNYWVVAYTSGPGTELKVCDNSACSGLNTGFSSDSVATTSHGFTFNHPGGNINLYVQVKGNTNGWVYSRINAGTTYAPDGQIATAQASAEAQIPEFATVAIPIAAVLGLVFFFQRKKNKEE